MAKLKIWGGVVVGVIPVWCAVGSLVPTAPCSAFMRKKNPRVMCLIWRWVGECRSAGFFLILTAPCPRAFGPGGGGRHTVLAADVVLGEVLVEGVDRQERLPGAPVGAPDHRGALPQERLRQQRPGHPSARTTGLTCGPGLWFDPCRWSNRSSVW